MLVIKTQRHLVFHHQQYSLNSSECQSSNRARIGQLNNSMDSLEKTLYVGFLQSNRAPADLIARDME